MMRCEFCKSREAVHHQHRTSYGSASICDPCHRITIGDHTIKPSAGFFCCVTIESSSAPTQTAAIGAIDGRPKVESNYVQ